MERGCPHRRADPEPHLLMPKGRQPAVTLPCAQSTGAFHSKELLGPHLLTQGYVRVDPRLMGTARDANGGAESNHGHPHAGTF